MGALILAATLGGATVFGVLAAAGFLTRGDAGALIPLIGNRPNSSGQSLATPAAPNPNDAEYRSAIVKLAQAGYAVDSAAGWGVPDRLHVLVGQRTGAPGNAIGWRAFFFVGGDIVGTDAESDSADLRVVARSDADATLAYDLFAPSDPVGHPSRGSTAVRFHWDGQRLQTVESLPSDDWSAPESRRGTPQQAAPGVRPIVFIPGIEGSYLTDANGREVWPALQAFLDQSCIHVVLAYVDGGCEASVLAPDAFDPGGSAPPGDPVDVGNGVDHPLDGNLGGVLGTVNFSVLAGIYSKTLHAYDITAELARQSGYTVVQSDTSAGLSVCAGNRRCFVPVGIDWRRGAYENAERVFAVIQRVLSVTGSDRVDILAHSQGGLIASALVHAPQTVGKIYRLVTLGTPFLGAPKILSVLLYGTPCVVDTHYFGCPLDSGVVQNLVKNYPGVAELLPSRDYYLAAPSAPLALQGSGLAYDGAQAQIRSSLQAAPLNTSSALVDAANAFHSAVDKWAPIDSSVGLVRMIGFDAGSGTGCDAAPCGGAQIGSYAPTGTEIGVDISSHGLYFGTGDGTVPPLFRQCVQWCGGRRSRSWPQRLLVCRLSPWAGVVDECLECHPIISVRFHRLLAGLHGSRGTCPDGQRGSAAGLLGGQ